MNKKYVVWLFPILFTLALLFNACKEDDGMETTQSINDSEYYTESGTVSMLKEEAIQYISETITEGDVLIFSQGTPKEVLPQIGTNILVPVSERTPYGFLGKVKSITEEGTTIKVQTETIALDEAFPNLSIDTTFNILENIEGIFDEEGHPVEYYLEDDVEVNARADMEYDWEKKRIVIPVPKEMFGEEFTVSGSMSLSFKGSKFDLDNKDEVKYLNLTLTPKFSVDVEITSEINGGKKEFSTKKLYIKGKVIAGPVVIPLTIPVYLKWGMKGELTTSLRLQHESSCEAFLQYKNDEWNWGAVPTNTNNKNPWSVNRFDVNGEIYGGVSLAFIAGVFTTNIGAGFELFPKISIEASADLSSINPLEFNPEATIGGKLESSVFCMAKLFGKGWKEFKIPLPQANLLTTTVSIFPNISEFTAIGGSSSSGEISYQSDSYYLLQGLGVKTGATVYESDQTSEIETLYPAHTSVDNNGVRYYNAEVDGLRAGETYYAAPIISWLDYKWVGEQHEFITEASYDLGFRCVNQSYDVINFNFSLNDETGNIIDYTTEAQDYNGSLMRVRITARYDEVTRTLDGIFDFFFYDDPAQKRQDGFSVSLVSDDSGYVNCSKVVDNGGCYAALRISKSGTKAAQRKYTRALMEDDCNIGIFNKNYQR